VRRTGAGDLAVAIEDRHINVFLGPDEEALARQLGSYLVEVGFLGSAEHVETSTEEVLSA
jgi:hypothetical protein